MATQLMFNLLATLPKNAYEYGNRASGEAHGVVLTKPHIVELILDLAGYTRDRDLAGTTLLEPSCGHGAFLVSAVTRLLATVGHGDQFAATLENAVLAFDIEREHVELTRAALLPVLRQHGITGRTAKRLVETWVREGDFLLAGIDRKFDFVIGNPPYVRIEQLSPALQAEYRCLYHSLYDRADLYVAFIERGLSLLGTHPSTEERIRTLKGFPRSASYTPIDIDYPAFKQLVQKQLEEPAPAEKPEAEGKKED